MLKEEVDKLKGVKKIKSDREDNKPLLEVETHISDDYVPDDEIKMEIHKKINEVSSLKDIDTIREELENRFGKITEEMLVYMHEEWFEKQAKVLDVAEVNQTKTYVEIILSSDMSKKIDGDKLFFLAYDISKYFRFLYKNNRIHILIDTVKLDKHFIYYLNTLFSKMAEVFKN